MTTEELLTLERGSFIEALKEFDDHTCEKHVRNILTKLNGPSFETYVKRIVDTALPINNDRTPNDVETYYMTTKQLFPQVSMEDDVLGRLTALVLSMMAQRLEKSSIEL